MIHKFVDNIPRELENGVIYISIKYCSIIHKCPCGCGSEIVTPIDAEKGWKLIFDGKSVSLYPSIGNWHLNCQSHYWIKNNKVIWAIETKDEKPAKKRKKKFSIKNLFGFNSKNNRKRSKL